MDALCLLSHYENALEIAHLRYRELAELQINRSFPRYALVSSLLYVSDYETRKAVDRMIAEVSLCRIALSLVAYKDRHGSYPDTLDQLREKVGWEIPEDPFSGEDFKYRREGEGFILYSIGPNLRDDGGEITPWPHGDVPKDERKDDIVVSARGEH